MTLQQLDIDRLTTTERLDLIGQIWDSLVEEDAPITVLESHRAELERRIQAADEDPGAVVPWEEAKARLLSRP